MASEMRADGRAAFGSLMLLALSFLMIVAGVSYDWIRMPVSAAMSGLQLPYTETGAALGEADVPMISQGGALLAVVLLGLLGEAVGLGRVRRLLSGLGLAMLLFLPVYLVCIDGRWLESYVAEGRAFMSANSLLGVYFVPNLGLDSMARYMTDFETLSDRLQLAWSMLGSGWMMAFIGICILIMVPEIKAGSTFTAPVGAFTVIAVAAMILAFGWGAIKGEQLRAEGEALLAQGEYSSALAAFSDAIKADPVLERSTGFMLEVSKAEYGLAGERHSGALPYLAQLKIQAFRYDEGFAYLRRFLSARDDHSGFREGLLQAAAKLSQAAYIARGSSSYARSSSSSRNGRALAAADFEAALGAGVQADVEPVDVNIMLARFEFDLRQYDRCVLRVEQLLGGPLLMKSVMANLQSTAGDCYAGKGDLGEARNAYVASDRYDSRDNFRAIQGLGGF